MTDLEVRKAIVAKGKTRLKKNKYTQGENRNKVGQGYSDCSSFVRWCVLKVTGIDIGGNTAAQIVSGKMETIHKGGKYPPRKLLLPGDMLYFKGKDKSRPQGVGHVEMFNGKKKLMGHGSGIGPRLKDVVTYCLYKWGIKRGYICTRRVILTDASVDRNDTHEAIKPTQWRRSPHGDPEQAVGGMMR